MPNQAQASRRTTECKVLYDDGTVRVEDITHQYPKMDNVIQQLSVVTNVKFDMKKYLAELDELGIPKENVGLSFCG